MSPAGPAPESLTGTSRLPSLIGTLRPSAMPARVQPEAATAESTARKPPTVSDHLPHIQPAPAPSVARGPAPEPVFVGGYPRSGTSLLVALLDGHPDLLVLPEETWFLKDVSRRVAVSGVDAVEHLFERTNLRHLDPGRSGDGADPTGVGIADYDGFPYARLREITSALFQDSAGAPPDVLRSLGMAFAEVTGAGHRRYLVEKTPDNEFRMGTARGWWPQCRFVHVLRDPRAAFHSHVAKASAASRALPVETFVLHYARSLAVGLRHISTAPDLSMLVKYEDLVAAPDPAMRRLARFLGVPFDPSLLTPTKLGKPWTGVGSGGEVGDRVVADRVEVWRDGLHGSDVRYIETFLGKAMLFLGYPLASGLATSREFLAALRGPASVRWQTLRAMASLYKPVGLVRRHRGTSGRA